MDRFASLVGNEKVNELKTVLEHHKSKGDNGWKMCDDNHVNISTKIGRESYDYESYD